MTSFEWARYLLENGEIKKQNTRVGKYIVLFKNTFYLIYNGVVVYTSFYQSTCNRVYNTTK